MSEVVVPVVDPVVGHEAVHHQLKVIEEWHTSCNAGRVVNEQFFWTEKNIL